MAKSKAVNENEKSGAKILPDEEWPYEVPGNWVWCQAGDIFNMQAGSFISAKEIKDVANDVHAYPCYGGNGIRGYVNIFNCDGEFPIIGRQGALCGNINFATGKFYATEHAVVVSGKQDLFIAWARYLLLYLNLNQYATATAQPGLAVSKILTVLCPLPPLPEQHRIANRIESMFDKLNRAKELVQSALDTFELRKAAILRKAFTGELSAKWREDIGITLDSWQNTNLGHVLQLSTEKADDFSNGTKYLSLEHLEKNRGIVGHGYADDVKSQKNVFASGDILYGRLRPYLNKHGIASFSGVCSTDILVFKAKDSCIAKFVDYFFDLDSFILYAVSNSKGINLPRVSQDMVLSAALKLPTLPEQQEITRILESLLEKEKAAHELASIIEKIDHMKKAILARAFRGELGTNDPSEESALGLLQIKTN